MGISADSARDAVVAYILQKWSEAASLAEILRDLCAWLEPDEEEAEEERVPTAAPTPEELFGLIAATTERRDALMFRVFWASGIRNAELRRLRVGDHDHTVGTLFVRGGKGDKDRYVLLDPVTNQLLKAWTWNQPPERVIFPLGATGVWHVTRKWADKVGLTQKYAALGLRFSPHSFRHSMGTHCYARGMPLASVQYLQGHEWAGTTNLYIHGGIDLWRARYQQPVAPGPSCPWRVRPSGGPQRADVVNWILETVPPEGRLEQVIAALAQLRMDTMPLQDQELVELLSGEIGLPDLVLGSRLPIVPSPFWVEKLSRASGLPVLVQFLCATGVLPHELPGLSEFDFERGIVKVGKRFAVVDPATAQAVREHPEALRVAPEAVETQLLGAARETGLQARYEGVGRTFTSTALRHVFGSRLCEAGLDLLALHNLLGNRSWVTTECYAAVSPGVHRAAYLESHPLAAQT